MKRQSPLDRALRDPSGAPLSRGLRDDLGEERIKAMWQRIDHAPRSTRPRWLASLATAALTLAVLLALGREGEERLTLTDGSSLSVLSADEKPLTPSFDDGSSVTLLRGARLEVLRNDRRSFVTALRRGNASFDIKPGGPRRWVIEAGEVSVEVVGTRFRVERQSELTRVSVDHGVVMVRGERVPRGAMRLTAGEHFELPVPLAATSALSGGPAPAPVPAAIVPSARPAPAPASKMASAPETSGDEIDRELGAADEARASQDSAAAAIHFERAFRLAPAGDPRRGLAGLSLARLALTTDPARAAGVLRSCLRDMPSSLQEDALARLVEAEARAGNSTASQLAAEEYRRRFAQGARAAEVERWSAP